MSDKRCDCETRNDWVRDRTDAIMIARTSRASHGQIAVLLAVPNSNSPSHRRLQSSAIVDVAYNHWIYELENVRMAPKLPLQARRWRTIMITFPIVGATGCESVISLHANGCD